ncbi:probable calcium-binding protein CML27 [Phalaenopsis equestris]|uniref:probable calcium-binding protein CML27 n=1 Tax=Phalaenopsis equestris TaxID=78828 RepID=UPI0009E34F16|nr:probable calcium-binding protein CML27 [Phalaenopsis equestris]XP_020596769.1 probable calcium-binding protein CML27 [Phalaenopsis equestris]
MAGEIPPSQLAIETPLIVSSLKPHLLHTSPSFRLRSPSLNSLRLRRVFDIFDRNGDGEITSEELCLALDCLGLGVDPAELCSSIASYIPTGRLGLDFDSFNSIHRSLGDALFNADGSRGEVEEEEEMREAFRVFDEDGDGFISAKELQVVLGKLGLAEGRTLDRVQLMIGSVDRDSDGLVDFFEFKTMMKTVNVQSA